MITIISGSPRKNSNTIRVAKAISNYYTSLSAEHTAEIIDFNGYDIPSANVADLHADSLTPWQQHLYDSVSKSHLVFILTPEYNWFPSAEIIQMIHAMTSRSFKTMWDNKVFATGGVSNGRGGRMPAVQLSYSLNKIISVFGYQSLVSAKMFESQFTDKVLDDEGNSLGNEEYRKGLKVFIDYNLNMSDRWKK